MDKKQKTRKIDMVFDEVIVFSNPEYKTAFEDITDNGCAVYNYDKMVQWLMNEEHMSEEEAVDFISYNCSFSYGEGYPIIYYPIWEDI